MYEPEPTPYGDPVPLKTDPITEPQTDDLPFELFAEELPEAEALALPMSSAQSWSSLGGSSLSTLGCF